MHRAPKRVSYDVYYVDYAHSLLFRRSKGTVYQASPIFYGKRRYVYIVTASLASHSDH
jgi:hypothetical protein